MRRSPRQLDSPEALHTSAIRALMRRAHSISEMRKTLERRCRDADLVQAELARLKQQNLLDDARYARDFARTRAAGRRQGRMRITQELRRRGVPDRHIEEALEEVFATNDESALLRERLQRKLRSIRGPLDERRLASIYRSLLRAGFSPDQVRKAINTVARGATSFDPEAASPDDPGIP
ncbi:MAG TPA: regulatory protein RecX [Candidatus Acidoferrales bacterium]|nr:regulatory protein RecX [Candidatus Acidoferrales bacterium]